MMRKYYIAVTYDVCEHNDLFIDMHNYKIESIMDLDKQIKEIAKMDIAPVVEVYESNTSDFRDSKLYKEYTFKEYECRCDASQM